MSANPAGRDHAIIRHHAPVSPARVATHCAFCPIAKRSSAILAAAPPSACNSGALKSASLSGTTRGGFLSCAPQVSADAVGLTAGSPRTAIINSQSANANSPNMRGMAKLNAMDLYSGATRVMTLSVT